jgi:cytosine/adenosine deaminase-related metal-dependent hydrolase
LNLLEEIRLVHRLRPEVSVQSLFEMVTWRGAKALGLERIVGRLARGMRADHCVFRLKGEDPFLELLESDPAIVEVGLGDSGDPRRRFGR